MFSQPTCRVICQGKMFEYASGFLYYKIHKRQHCQEVQTADKPRKDKLCGSGKEKQFNGK